MHQTSSRLAQENYHKHPDKLKTALELAGVPAKILALVDEAIALCGDCRAHSMIKAVPKVVLRLVTRFNYEVCFDLVFFMDWAYVIFMDSWLRFVRIAFIPNKTSREYRTGFAEMLDNIIWCPGRVHL